MQQRAQALEAAKQAAEAAQAAAAQAWKEFQEAEEQQKRRAQEERDRVAKEAEAAKQAEQKRREQVERDRVAREAEAAKQARERVAREAEAARQAEQKHKEQEARRSKQNEWTPPCLELLVLTTLALRDSCNPFRSMKPSLSRSMKPWRCSYPRTLLQLCWRRACHLQRQRPWQSCLLKRRWVSGFRASGGACLQQQVLNEFRSTNPFGGGSSQMSSSLSVFFQAVWFCYAR